MAKPGLFSYYQRCFQTEIYILTPPGFELVVEGENVEHWTTSATTCTVSFRPPDGARCEPMTLKLKGKRATYESPEHKIVIKV